MKYSAFMLVFSYFVSPLAFKMSLHVPATWTLKQQRWHTCPVPLDNGYSSGSLSQTGFLSKGPSF